MGVRAGGVNRGAVDRVLQFVTPNAPVERKVSGILHTGANKLVMLNSGRGLDGLISNKFRVGYPFSPDCLCRLTGVSKTVVLGRRKGGVLVTGTRLTPSPNMPSARANVQRQATRQITERANTLIVTVSREQGIVALCGNRSHCTLHSVNIVLAGTGMTIRALRGCGIILRRDVNGLDVLRFRRLIACDSVLRIFRGVRVILHVGGRLLACLDRLNARKELVQLRVGRLLVRLRQRTR